MAAVGEEWSCITGTVSRKEWFARLWLDAELLSYQHDNKKYRQTETDSFSALYSRLLITLYSKLVTPVTTNEPH